MSDTQQEQLIELQHKVQFQEDALQQLDDVVIRQNQQIDQLVQRIDQLEDRLEELSHRAGTAPGELDERPPHY